MRPSFRDQLGPLRMAGILVFSVLAAACAKSVSSEEPDLVQSILSAEEELGMAYFAGDIGLARAALDEYLTYLDSIEPNIDTIAETRAFNTGRALAITRLELLKASEAQSVPNLDEAVEMMRTGLIGSEQSSDQEIASALIELIRGDQQFVPWLNNLDGAAERVRANYSSSP